MARSSDRQTGETRRVTERLLAATFGGAVRLDDGVALQERAYVRRFAVLGAPSGAPSSVVVKRAEGQGSQAYDPDHAEPFTPAWRLFNDWAGLEFLGQVAPAAGLAPRLYAGDRASGTIVIEDLGSEVSPDRLLLSTDGAAAERALVEMARTLGRMHASTIGKSDDYDRILGSIDPRASSRRDGHDWRSLTGAMLQVLEAVGLRPRMGAADELAALIDRLETPGPFLAYTHGDPCPDNWKQTAAGLRLFDFAFGGFRHALLDGVYGRIHFPTCWCVNRLPQGIPLRMEEAYRAELALARPEAADDELFYTAVVDACAAWSVRTCSNVDFADLLKGDREWGVSTVRQRVLVRADILVDLTRQLGHLEALGETMADLAAKLRSLWPAEADAMPFYPAFR